jgi:hypothetical protein
MLPLKQHGLQCFGLVRKERKHLIGKADPSCGAKGTGIKGFLQLLSTSLAKGAVSSLAARGAAGRKEKEEKGLFYGRLLFSQTML